MFYSIKVNYKEECNYIRNIRARKKWSPTSPIFNLKPLHIGCNKFKKFYPYLYNQLI